MSRLRSNNLSVCQRRVLRAIATLEEQGQVAFIRAILEVLGFRGESSLTPTLRRLERKGCVLSQGGGKGKSRVISLTAKGRFEAAIGGLPLLGTIPAGNVEEAVQHADMILDERELIKIRPGDFALSVKGDSMVGDGILDGDKVVMRPNVHVENGEIAAVVTTESNEATLKRIFFDTAKREVVLRASNPLYPDKRLRAGQVRIAGVFRGLIRDQTRSRR